ncbi:hypothetical protein C8A00DRAFT_46731 [Chaetomidium leptoderma]|uniref:Uncharacterized protein n=1 Tax=Chaetomidium leptoderma TaxID=669021 RepID=A0AAN6VE52_9PEZI|nr:hypothetical protein C8A00DRAFT_46731 [Chaetomidium leptoderma]
MARPSNTHKDKILNLFISQKKSLREVAAEMNEKVQLSRSVRLASLLWISCSGSITKLTSDAVTVKGSINIDSPSSKALGKLSVPCLHGQKLPESRMKRRIAQARATGSRITKPLSNRKSLPRPKMVCGDRRITVRTPSPVTVGGYRFRPTANMYGREERGSVLEMADLLMQDVLPSPSVAFSIEPPVVPDISQGWSGQLDVVEGDMDVGFDFEAFITSLRPESTVELGFSRRSGSHPQSRSPSIGVGLTPFFDLVSFEFDSSSSLGGGLMTNLPWFQVLVGIDQQPGMAHIHFFFSEFRRNALSTLLGSAIELSPAGSLTVAEVATQFQGFVPKRHEGDLSDKLGRVLDTPSPVTSTLPTLFALTAFFASNNGLDNKRMDAFLEWIIRQKYAEFLARFMEIQAPTVHAFAKTLVYALLDSALEFGSLLDKIASIGDNDFTKRVLMKADPSYFKTDAGARLFLDNGVSVDIRAGSHTALMAEVYYGDIETVGFLVEAGADINAYCPQTYRKSDTPFTQSVYQKKPVFVALFLQHRPTLSSDIEGKSAIEWASLHCRNICNILKKYLEPTPPGFLLGDLVDAANLGAQALIVYVGKQPNGVLRRQLEQGLEESIRGGHFMAAITLLQHGVDPDCLTLNHRPLETAVRMRKWQHIDLLLRHGADARLPGLLGKVARSGDHPMLGIDIDTPGLDLNPRQTAANGHMNMVMFLIHRGANVNAPASDNGGRTALQSALEGEMPVEIAEILLRHRADASAPPAMNDGVTAVEAFCNNWEASRRPDFCETLLGAGATVNRPNRQPGSVLHGIIGNCDGPEREDWYQVLAKVLEPQHNTIDDYMWCDRRFADDSDPEEFKPYTPTQLAASNGDLKAVMRLLDYGAANVNERPGDRFGRTALQAASQLDPSPAKMELITFLLDRGADVNAEAGLNCGITALQGAAITGDIKLAELLLLKGADVNALPSFEDGRYAIEGAAEHGRLDMTQVLLNAGAKGNRFRGTGFQYAIELAEKEGHFAIANLLKAAGSRL